MFILNFFNSKVKRVVDVDKRGFKNYVLQETEIGKNSTSYDFGNDFDESPFTNDNANLCNCMDDDADNPFAGDNENSEVKNNEISETENNDEIINNNFNSNEGDRMSIYGRSSSNNNFIILGGCSHVVRGMMRLCECCECVNIIDENSLSKKLYCNEYCRQRQRNIKKKDAKFILLVSFLLLWLI
jgi:hypothetical protein